VTALHLTFVFLFHSFVAVALTCRYRDTLLVANDPTTLQRAMRQVPRCLMREPTAMEALEEVITMALSFMYVHECMYD